MIISIAAPGGSSAKTVLYEVLHITIWLGVIPHPTKALWRHVSHSYMERFSTVWNKSGTKQIGKAGHLACESPRLVSGNSGLSNNSLPVDIYWQLAIRC